MWASGSVFVWVGGGGTLSAMYMSTCWKHYNIWGLVQVVPMYQLQYKQSSNNRLCCKQYIYMYTSFQVGWHVQLMIGMLCDRSNSNLYLFPRLDCYMALSVPYAIKVCACTIITIKIYKNRSVLWLFIRSSTLKTLNLLLLGQVHRVSIAIATVQRRSDNCAPSINFAESAFHKTCFTDVIERVRAPI